MSGTARLFVALWPGPKTREAIAAACPAWPAGGKVEAAHRWHLTLHFIGSVGADRVAEVARGLRLQGPRFELQLTRLVAWPGGLVALAPDDTPPALTSLHEGLGQALTRLALPLEARAFRPHVTLARRARGIQAAPLAAPIRWPVRGYSLVVSAGAYRRIAEYPLG